MAQANNLIQIKRTSISGRAANTTTLPNPGELALNMTDGILYSGNGSVVFEIGANNTNVNISGNLAVKAIIANNSIGSYGQVLYSSGSDVYWGPGASGFTGSRGDTGYTGSFGATGFTGSVGYVGSRGDVGFVGSQGDIGYTGSQGVGFTGSVGYAGSQGDLGYTGSAGSDGSIGYNGSVGYVGSQGNAGYTGSQGDLGEIGPVGYTGSRGDLGYTGSQGVGFTGSVGYVGSQGDLGYTGSQGPQGSFGGAAFDYTFNANTGNSNPTNGNLKLNNTDLTLANTLYISENADNFQSIYTFLQTIDDSTSAIKGHFTVTEKANTTNFVLYAITGSHAYYTNYFAVPSSYLNGSANNFTNNLDIIITFARTGDIGDTGFTGSTGYVGSKGDLGYTGSKGDLGGVTYDVTNSGSGNYVILGNSNPTITLARGLTYYFNINASGHPFWIKTAQVTGTGSAYSSGVTNNGVDIGIVTFTVPLDAPNTLYYICQHHGGMAGIFTIRNLGELGYTGSEGSAGFTGSVGFTGSIGIGFTGSQGDLGYTGSRGTDGVIGYDGSVGFTGSQGAGFTGSVGFAGSQGDIGFTGSIGPGGAGSVGYTGSQGDVGYTGSRGTDGVIGYNGSVGFTGSGGTGFTGSAGAGFVGSKGDIGFTGSAGTGGGGGGASVTVSNTAPTTNVVSGNLWWHTEEGTLKIYYEDGDSNQWVDASNPSPSFNAISLTGPISANTITAAYSLTGASLSVTGTAAAGDLTITNNISTGSMTVSGALSLGDLVVSTVNAATIVRTPILNVSNYAIINTVNAININVSGNSNLTYILANNSQGTAGQLLISGGASTNVSWRSFSTLLNTDNQTITKVYTFDANTIFNRNSTFANAVTFSNTATFSKAVTFSNTVAIANVNNVYISNTTIRGFREQTVSNTAVIASEYTLDPEAGSMHLITLTTATTTISLPSPVLNAGRSITLIANTGISGGYNVTWSNVTWPDGVTPYLSTTAGKKDVMSFVCDGSTWYGIFSASY